MYILVLESSTSSAKALLYCTEKGVIDIKTKTYLTQYNDIETQDADGVFNQTIELGRQVSEGYEIDAVSLCGTWHSVVVCDKDMHPKTRTLSWTYTGAAEIAKKLREDKDFTNNFYQKTGCMVNATYPAFKLMHLKEEGLSLHNSYIAGQGSYNYYRLTGERVVTESMASGSGLLNIHTKKYDEAILEMIGIKEEQIGRIINFSQTYPLNEEGANLLGIKKGIPVIAANPDGALNQVGAGALKDGVMTFSVGTSAAIRLTVPKPVLPGTPSTWCYLSPISWLSGAATSGACNCIDWIKGKMFDKSVSYSDIEKQDVDIKNLPVFMPFLYGERCPGWQDSRLASFHDVRASHKPADFYYSVMEGVLFNIYHCYKSLKTLNGEPNKIKLSGGILNSRIWTQMCCDIFGKEMEISKLEQTSVLGGVVLALKVLGIINDIKEFSFEDGEMIYPNHEKRDMYTEKFQKYKYWYEKTM